MSYDCSSESLRIEKEKNTRTALNQRFLCFYFCATALFRFYVPCTPLSVTNLLLTLFVFLILIFFLVFTAQKLANIPGIGEIVEKFSRWIMAIIYIALGLFIIIENDTIQTILGFIF
ncbi:cadmium transporter [Staphylococcus aureus]|nr:cadmium transporter [Staphylococcus aureus]